MNTERFEVGVLVLGTFLVSAGGALTAVYAFQGKVLPVLTGYVFFTAGYKLSWYGTHSLQSFEDLKSYLQSFEKTVVSHIAGDIHNYFLIILGLLMSSFGTVKFGSMVVNELKLFGVAWAGLLCFGGYMVAHEGINEVLV